jgi:hypothetical protein
MTNSVYELMHPLTIERKTRFWDWFDGDDLRNWWNFTDVAGTGSGAMVDSVDEGYGVTSGASDNNNSEIDFNNIEHYDFNNSIVQFIARTTLSTSRFLISGLMTDKTVQTHLAGFQDDSDRTFSVLNTGNGSETLVDTTLGHDTNFHIIKIDIFPTFVKLYIDGALEATSTSNLPDQAMQPYFRMGTRTTAARTGHIRYLEAYNT